MSVDMRDENLNNPEEFVLRRDMHRMFENFSTESIEDKSFKNGNPSFV